MSKQIVMPPPRDLRVLVCQVDTHIDAVWRSFRLRRRIFVEELGWNLKVRNGYERDQFDRRDTVYCILLDGDEAVASWRMIPTTKPYLLAEQFSHLASGIELPHTKSVWEISRFGVDPNYSNPDFCVRLLLDAMFEFAMANQIVTIVAVTDRAFETVLRRAGLNLFSYGNDTHNNGERGSIIAGGLHLAEQTHQRYRHLLAPVSKEAA